MLFAKTFGSFPREFSSHGAWASARVDRQRANRMNQANASRIGAFLGVATHNKPLWLTVENVVEHQLLIETNSPHA